MKKKNLSSLVFKKNKISNLHNLTRIIGGTGPGSEAAFNTLNTACGATYEANCKTYNPEECDDTTRTIADNTFEESCDCTGILTGAAC